MSNLSLQALALKNTLETLALTDDMQQVIKEFTLNYMTSHPQLITKALNKTGLYNVFFREEDERCFNEGPKRDDEISCPEIQLIISFPTEKQAVDWVMANGRGIVLGEEIENRNRPIVLTIIHYDNRGQCREGEEPAHLYGISDNQYPTFAFTKRGFEMLQREHMVNLQMHSGNGIVPWWITHVDKRGKLTRGWSMRHLCEYHSTMSYRDDDAVKKQRDVVKLQRFHSNPDKYIVEKRAIK